MTDDPDKPTCLMCATGYHDDCLFLTRPTSCGCLCRWLVDDVRQAFPSLGDQ